MKIVYANLNRSPEATENILQTAHDIKADVVVSAEPNKRTITNTIWITDSDMDAAVAIYRGNRPIRSRGGKGFVWADTGHITIVGCYISPNANITRFDTFLNDLHSEIKKVGGKTLIIGDFNAKHRLWGSKRTDSRGKKVMEWAATNLLTLHNDGDKPTFQRGKQTSYIDLTFSTSDLAPYIRNWQVMDQLDSLSDHNYIAMEVDLSNGASSNDTTKTNALRFRPDRADNFLDLASTNLVTEVPMSPNDYIRTTQKLCEATFQWRKPNSRRPVYWWCTEVAEARAKCNSARRRYSRAKRRAGESACLESWRSARSELKQAIR